jgi:hypothetical protein
MTALQILGANPAMRRAWLEHNTGHSLEAAAEAAFAPEAGGANACVLGDSLDITPCFILTSAREAIAFSQWLHEHLDELREVAAQTTTHGVQRRRTERRQRPVRVREAPEPRRRHRWRRDQPANATRIPDPA